jgi:hypothetical protein
MLLKDCKEIKENIAIYDDGYIGFVDKVIIRTFMKEYGHYIVFYFKTNKLTKHTNSHLSRIFK